MRAKELISELERCDPEMNIRIAVAIDGDSGHKVHVSNKETDIVLISGSALANQVILIGHKDNENDDVFVLSKPTSEQHNNRME